ncbi:MAG: hypothetical protein PVF90_08845 [Gemmatimonadota bacterium]|jgi:hypothetical protein
MRQRLRRPLLALTALALAACHHWVPRLESPAVALSDPELTHVRLTRTNRQQVELRIAEIRNDSIYGTLGGSGPLSCVEAGPGCNARLALAEVGFVEQRSFSPIRTVAVVLIPVGAIVVASITQGSCHNGPVDSC